MMTTETIEVFRRLVADGSYCPSSRHNKFSVRPLLRLATANKSEHALFHFLDCPVCGQFLDSGTRKLLEKRRIRLRALPLVFASERRKIDRLLRSCRLRGICFKQYTGREYVGNDLDILIEEKDFLLFVRAAKQLGYTYSLKALYKEIKLTNPANNFVIDAHHLLAYPHFGWLSRRERRMLIAYASDLLAAAKRRRFGCVTLSTEQFIVTRVLHYWYNDILCGLSPLREIALFCRRHRADIHWDSLFHIADRYGLRHEILFVLKAAEIHVGIPFPPQAGRIPLRVLAASYALTLCDIVLFPPVVRWDTARYRGWARQRYATYHLITLLVSQSVPLHRIIRPRMFALVAPAIGRFIRRKNS